MAENMLKEYWELSCTFMSIQILPIEYLLCAQGVFSHKVIGNIYRKKKTLVKDMLLFVGVHGFNLSLNLNPTLGKRSI